MQKVQTAPAYPISHRLELKDPYNPRGPDGQGRNRLGLWSLSPTPRCSLRPQTRQAALDTARGMAFFGSITSYGACTEKAGNCSACQRHLRPRDTWREGWCLREDLRGNVWLVGDAGAGFGGRGYAFANWEGLFDEVEVPALKRLQDAAGFYWAAA
ncbi:hypothetical protein, partial [Rubrivivax gelatinosus]|uniref:hypothetical protein n=1 Tax=Rubrivivax gelatinosus TaxID=28068 RepID=UPI0005C21447